MERSENGNGIRVLFTNAQSIVNKIEELRAVVAMEEPDVVAVTETWTNENIGEEYLQIKGYEIITRKDRNDTDRGRGGGVIVYVHKNLNAWCIDNETTFNQCTSIGVKCKSEKLAIHLVYRSPNSSKDNDNALVKWMKEFRGTNIMIGDYNFPDINWADGTAGAKGREFHEATLEAGMEQYVDEATHTSGNVLDLVLSDHENIVKSVNVNGRIGKSDHDNPSGHTRAGGNLIRGCA